jgi:acetyl-CoA carboxylase biotin carboxyl carrier protein
MFKLSEIKDLIKLIDQSSLHELEIQNEGYKLTIRKPNKTESLFVSSAPPQYALPVQAAAQQLQQTSGAHPMPDAAIYGTDTKNMENANLHKIISPMVGTFYQSPSPDADAYVTAGSKVKEKTVVCIVEAMKLMNEIEAEINGEIVEVLVENGQLVEYGQPLFLVRPE